MTLEFRDEPPSGRGNRERSEEIAELVEELKLHPGMWARVAGPSLRQSSYKPWKYRGCDVVSRRINGEYELWARWPAERDEGVS